MLHAEENPLEIYRQGSVELFRRGLGQALVDAESGVVDQDIQPTELADRLRHQISHLLLFRDVAYDRGDLTSCVPQLGFCLFEGSFAPTRDNHPGSLTHELLSNTLPDALRASGYYSYSTF